MPWFWTMYALCSCILNFLFISYNKKKPLLYLPGSKQLIQHFDTAHKFWRLLIKGNMTKALISHWYMYVILPSAVSRVFCGLQQEIVGLPGQVHMPRGDYLWVWFSHQFLMGVMDVKIWGRENKVSERDMEWCIASKYVL